MPTIRRREARRRQNLDALSDEEKSHLLRGWHFFDGGFTDEILFRTAWNIHADDLMVEFREEHRDETFARPFGWWFCEGRERPLQRTDAESLRLAEVMRNENKHGDHFGFLCTAIYGGPEMTALQQPQWEYLEENNLLTDEECTFLATIDADRPEGIQRA